MKNSKIGWTDDTANPIQVKGGGFICIKVSRGCKHCYAERVNKMLCGFKHIEAHDYKVPEVFPELELREDILAGWAKLGRPRKIFVTSMSDVFGEFVPKEWIFKILDAMVVAWKQTFQVLTKRSGRARDIVNEYCVARGYSVLPKNIWIIVSIEDMKVIGRALDLIQTNCQVKGLSIEPLVGEIDLTHYQSITLQNGEVRENSQILEHLHWVIVGGESGGDAEPMNPAWVFAIHDQCMAFGVPMFFKQWGEWVGGKLDTNKSEVLLQDGGIFYVRSNSPKIHYWPEHYPFNPYFKLVSARVGKKTRTLHWLGESKTTDSDNEKFEGSYLQEFPPFYTEPVKEVRKRRIKEKGKQFGI